MNRYQSWTPSVRLQDSLRPSRLETLLGYRFRTAAWRWNAPAGSNSATAWDREWAENPRRCGQDPHFRQKSFGSNRVPRNHESRAHRGWRATDGSYLRAVHGAGRRSLTRVSSTTALWFLGPKT